jgi:C4-dicarboxylate-specific signal transduction histidine kinase
MEREGERYIWSLIEDISERKRLERDVEQERMKAIQASKLATLGEMAAGIAHEINNPLTIIEGYAAMLPDLLREGDPGPIGQATDAIADATHRATRIVQGLRKFARESDHERSMDLPIRSVVEEALGLCRTRIRNHGVALRVEADGDARVHCNDIELTQVLINLLNNAFHAALQGHEKRITVECGRVGDWVELRVRDSGPGVPDAARDEIFQPFFTTKKAGDGTGLGLSISRGIVERLGGSLTLDPEAPETCFVLRLPAVRDPG